MKKMLTDAGIVPAMGITEVVASRPVQVHDAVVRIVQVRYARHERYNLYVQSMKAKRPRRIQTKFKF